eukprot:488036-Prymnesium_polylepis.1
MSSPCVCSLMRYSPATAGAAWTQVVAKDGEEVGPLEDVGEGRGERREDWRQTGVEEVDLEVLRQVERAGAHCAGLQLQDAERRDGVRGRQRGRVADKLVAANGQDSHAVERGAEEAQDVRLGCLSPSRKHEQAIWRALRRRRNADRPHADWRAAAHLNAAGRVERHHGGGKAADLFGLASRRRQQRQREHEDRRAHGRRRHGLRGEAKPHALTRIRDGFCRRAAGLWPMADVVARGGIGRLR